MRTLSLAALVLAGTVAFAQPAAPPTGLVVGSGNFFSPIVQDLDEALAFYRDGLGLAVQGPPGDAAANLPLRNMFGLPAAQIRWAIARPPGSQAGVEIIEIEGAGGEPLARRMQDSGAFTLLVIMRDIDAPLERLRALGARVLSEGGTPKEVPMGAGRPPARLVMVEDPDGHFVELIEVGDPPPADSAEPANVLEVRVRLTVSDLERSLRLYRDTLGLEEVSVSERTDNPTVAAALGVPGAQFRFGMLRIPASGIMFEVIEFANVARQTVTGRIQDPGSTRIQLRVSNVDAAIAALQPFGGEVVSTGGVPLELPAGNRSIKVAIVREPDNLFLVLIETPPASP